MNLSTTLLEREIQARWDGRSLSWKRDSQLCPGLYVWRVGVHDGNGKILSVAEEKIDVGFPGKTALGSSSLILGKSCRDDDAPASGLQRRSPPNASGQEKVIRLIDPMRAVDCRLKPESTGKFASTDTLHAFVRIYPSGKLGKHAAESWTAKFGCVPVPARSKPRRRFPLSSIRVPDFSPFEMRLNTAAVNPGRHTVDVDIHGPGIRGDLKKSRSIYIVSATNP